MTDDYRIRFLVVDDEQSIRKLCCTIGKSLGFVSAHVESAEAALSYIDAHSPDLVLADLKLANMDGLEFLEKLERALPRTEVAMMTGHGSIESAVQAMKLGAYDFITKPFRVDELKLVLQRMAEKVRLVSENEFLRERVSTEMELSGIIGSPTKIQDVLRMVARLKNTGTPVLITGESGTGKELVARAIHFRGSLAHRPFVAVDCGALVPTLIESELFGYERGAFTGALKPKDGLFQAANGGTLFLDEIGELPLEMQTKLLRALQEKEVRRVGSNIRTQVDVRIVAATNRDLEQAYREGTFRKDLYFRLNVVAVHLPALRERRSDIPSLVHFFLDKYVPDGTLQVSNAAMKALMEYDWPGNVRELQNCIERAVALGNRELIDVYDLPPALRNASDAFVSGFSDEPAPNADKQERTAASPVSKVSSPGVTPNDLEALEWITIQRVFDQVRGDKTLAGKMLGISRATLYRKIKRYQIKAASASA